MELPQLGSIFIWNFYCFIDHFRAFLVVKWVVKQVNQINEIKLYTY